MKAKPIQQILENLLNQDKLQEINEIINLEEVWNLSVGKAVAQNTEVLNYKNGVLNIKVSKPTWRNELAIQKTSILKIINKNTTTKITEIIFK